MTDLYKILGLKRDAKAAEIRKAFLKLSKKHHPDVGGDVERFRAIEEAYRTLSDEHERAYYDQHGTAPPKQAQGNPNAELYDMLTQCMMAAIQNMESPTGSDLITGMIAQIKTGQAKLGEGLRMANKQLERMEIVVRRIKAKGEDNTLRTLLQGQIDGMKAQLENTKRVLELGHKGIQFLRDYEYDADKALSFSTTRADMQDTFHYSMQRGRYFK